MSSVLVLNASYEPLNVVSMERAIRLLLKDRVDAATEDTITIHGKASSIDVPCVLRLRRYVNAPRRNARWSRRAVLARDGYTCIFCGVKAGEEQRGKILRHADFTIDHIVPRVQGGKSTWGNTACACSRCNHRKGGRTPTQANMTMLWEPKTPRVNYIVARGDVPASWKIYLES